MPFTIVRTLRDLFWKALWNFELVASSLTSSLLFVLKDLKFLKLILAFFNDIDLCLISFLNSAIFTAIELFGLLL